ncbi:hypothetical protein GALL_301910 [mine drainage metagenome]|uniref:Beta-propeller repeat protein n=1 Tax=mine drainage metagenome TaxID=410659 RepID=A0A1J5QW80_9ZZZZ
MNRSPLAAPLVGALAALMLTACGGGAGSGTSGPGYRVLHAFGAGTSPQAPSAGVIEGSDGTLYGVTQEGLNKSFGAVYSLDPASGRLSVLASFGANGTEQKPSETLVSDSAGNLYGTTQEGGKGGLGTVFEVDATTHLVTVLHAFTGGATDGATPSSALLIDAHGNLLGTTSAGGPDDGGTLFEISPQHTETILYAFGPEGAGNPRGPTGTLALDSTGELYGSTRYGGSANLGAVYVFTPGAGTAPGTVKVLHNFAGGADGAEPWSGVVLDAAKATLYGTTTAGGTADQGTVFACPVDGSGARVLYSFKASGSGDGAFPWGSLAIDSAGMLYGTTEDGGSDGHGTVFSLDPSSGTETVLHSFAGQPGGDGARPVGDLLIDRAGQLVGTTIVGGANANGTVFTLPR